MNTHTEEDVLSERFYSLLVEAVVYSSYKVFCAQEAHDSVAFALSGIGRKIKEDLMHAGYWIAGCGL